MEKRKGQFLIRELSVVIPAYNSERTLERCLLGVFGQKYFPPKFEVIVIDDGSTDTTAKIAKKFPVRLIKLPKNQGRIIARDNGVKKASFKYICFIDADCIPTKNWLLEILKENYQPIMGKVINNYQTALGRFFHLMRRFFYKPVLKPTKITEKNFLRLPTGAGNFLCSKEFYLKFDISQTGESFSDDQSLIFQINRIKPVLVIPNGTVSHDERYFLKDALSQWFNRGCRFADFHLKKGGSLSRKINLWLTIIILFTLIIIVFFGLKLLSCIYLLLILLSISLISFRMAENLKDLLIIASFLPIISFVFLMGAVRHKLR